MLGVREPGQRGSQAESPGQMGWVREPGQSVEPQNRTGWVGARSKDSQAESQNRTVGPSRLSKDLQAESQNRTGWTRQMVKELGLVIEGPEDPLVPEETFLAKGNEPSLPPNPFVETRSELITQEKRMKIRVHLIEKIKPFGIISSPFSGKPPLNEHKISMEFTPHTCIEPILSL